MFDMWHVVYFLHSLSFVLNISPVFPQIRKISLSDTKRTLSRKNDAEILAACSLQTAYDEKKVLMSLEDRYEVRTILFGQM
jgi:hypothetical protein